MAGRRFIPDDYVNVDERIRRYYDEGGNRIVTELAHLGDTDAVFKATIYKGDEVWAIGHAMGNVGDDKGLEKTETVAIGRALANAGFVRQGEQRASREEMEQFHEGQQASRVDPAVTEAAAKDQAAAKQAKHENAAKLAAFEAAGMDKDEAKKLYAQALEAVGFDKVETAGQVKVVKQWLTDNMVQTVLDAIEVKEET